jgi:predicted ATPase
MLQRIRIQNFKSLHDVEFTPGPTNVFVGPNASGKSNVLDALKFIAAASATNLIQAFNDRGGFQDVFWKGAGSRAAVAFELDLLLPPRAGEPDVFSYRFEIEMNRTGGFSVVDETLTAPGSASPLVEIVAGKLIARRLDGQEVFSTFPGNKLALLESNVPGWAGTRVRDALRDWRFYDLVPQAMKKIRPLAGAPVLWENGENLTEFLLTLKTTHAAEFRQLERAVQDCFPSFEELIPSPTQLGQVVLTARENGLNAPLNIWNMANGQLAFIALLALICAPPEMGSLLTCVEEPETHLHPKLVQQLVEVLFSRQTALAEGGGVHLSQLFITTHSPYLIDRVPPEALWLVSKNQHGETALKRVPDDESVRESLQTIGLGDLVFSGALGNR